MIKAEKLLKSYGQGELKLVVLKELDLEIGDGEMVAIIGPSGAGKSTLLYQLSLLDEPSGGEVFIEGAKTSELSQKQKTFLRLTKMGFVFQDYALLPELSALENVALPTIMQGASQSFAFEKAGLALERVGLGDKKNNLPSALSGGQQQRVSIARAIAHNPKIIFADEPTANLDTQNSLMVLEALLELNRQGETIVLVTHEEEYAEKADRVISLKDGEIVSDIRK